MPVDRREAEPGPATRGPHLDELGPVAAHERDARRRAEAARPAGRARAGRRGRSSSAKVRSPWGETHREPVRGVLGPERHRAALGREAGLCLGIHEAQVRGPGPDRRPRCTGSVTPTSKDVPMQPVRERLHRLGLRARVTVGFAGLAFLLSVGLAVFSYELTRSFVITRREETVRQQAYLNAAGGARRARGEPARRAGRARPDPDRRRQRGRAPGRSEWFGTSVGVGRNNVPDSLRRTGGRAAIRGRRTRGSRRPQHRGRRAARRRWTARTSSSCRSRELDSTLSLLARGLAAAAIVMTIIGAVVGRYASGRVLRPVRRMADTAGGIGDGEARRTARRRGGQRPRASRRRVQLDGGRAPHPDRAGGPVRVGRQPRAADADGHDGGRAERRAPAPVGRGRGAGARRCSSRRCSGSRQLVRRPARDLADGGGRRRAAARAG